jgi:hypothetical protein
MPPQDGLGFHKQQSVTPAWDQASEKHEQASLVGLQLRPVDCA